jgi:mono/diheme cytochrome c family protein
MLRITAVVLFIFGAVLIWGCSGVKKGKFVIAESKAYEASLFRQNCAICHGREAEGKTLENGTVIPNLRNGEFKYTTDDQIYRHIAEGGNGMVPFRNQLSERELRMMVTFVQRDLRGR